MKLLDTQLSVMQKLMSVYKLTPEAAEKMIRSIDPSLKWKLYKLSKST